MPEIGQCKWRFAPLTRKRFAKPEKAKTEEARRAWWVLIGPMFGPNECISGTIL
jgi:hypothetical protein